MKTLSAEALASIQPDALTGKKTLKPAVKAFGMIIGQHAAHDPAKPADHKWGGAK